MSSCFGDGGSANRTMRLANVVSWALWGAALVLTGIACVVMIEGWGG